MTISIKLIIENNKVINETHLETRNQNYIKLIPNLTKMFYN